MKMKFLKTFAVIASVCTLVACGGGGGSAGTNAFVPAPSSGASAAAAAADLVIQLSKATIDNTGVDSVTVTATALNANRVAVPGAPMTFTADSQALFAANAGVTDSTGSLQGTLRIGASRANRVITITVQSGSITKTATVQVIGAALSATLAPALVAPGASGTVSYRLVDKVNTAMANETITIAAPGLTPSSITAVTGPNGDYDFHYTVPGTLPGGPVTLSATAGGTSSSDILQIQGGTTVIPPAVGTVVSASVSANPSVVGINQVASTTNRSVIEARFLGAANAPISNMRVIFDLAGDANSIGGTFSSGTAMLYSDANGAVTTAYIPAQRSSPTDGVTVRACYGNTDLEATTCAHSAITKLTVAAAPLGVSIGTNNVVIETELTYIKKFVITVVDSAGQAMAGVDVAASVDLQEYRKGVYGGTPWAKTVDFTCVAEDNDRNGSLGATEDTNGNGRLDPGKSDVSITMLQTKTRADGTAELQLQYAQSFATWINAKITVSASGIAGTEGRASYMVIPLPAPSHAFTDTPAPAFAESPYGKVANCASPL